MDKTLHTLDPNGDVVLALRNPNAAFPLWTEEANEGNPALPQEAGRDVAIRIRVSSKHLTLASPYFNAMFKGNWKEGNALRSDGSVTLFIDNWDPDALSIVMNIIHGRTRQVPREVTIETLGKIAVIVDYYGCSEAVEVFSDMWINKLKDSIPAVSIIDTMVWILVSWVFRQEELFEAATKQSVIRHSFYISNRGLPIPESIILQLNSQRDRLIFLILADLHRLFDELLAGQKSCSHECACMLFGAFAKWMKSLNLYPQHTVPLLRLTVAGLVKHVRNIQTPKWARHTLGKNGPTFTEHKCNLNSLIKPILDRAEEQLKGLKLKDFLH